MAKKIRHSELREILLDMASYLISASREEENNYAKEIFATGLFHDAIGKIVEEDENSVTIITDY